MTSITSVRRSSMLYSWGGRKTKERTMSHLGEKSAGLTLQRKREMVARLLEAKAASGQHGTGLVHQWIEAQAARTPEAIAVSSPTDSISFRVLNGRANGLARRLQDLVVGPESL